MEHKAAKINWRDRIRRSSMILSIYGIGIAEAYQLPHYGIEWLLAGILVTALLATFWIRSHWD